MGLELDKALEEYTRALRIDPKFEDAYYTTGG